MMLSDPSGPQAEGVRALRTHLVAQHLSGGGRALAICSAEKGVGKTFTSVNLAVALAQIGVNVLLIDADLRSPNLQDYFSQMDALPGLSDFLRGEREVAGDFIRHDVIPNLSVIPSGGLVSAPQELLASKRFRELLDFAGREYEFTILDTPPAASFSDARDIASAVRHAVILSGKDVSSVRNVQILSDQLTIDGCKVLGHVLNGA